MPTLPDLPAVFRKLNLGAQPVLHVLDAPSSFDEALAALQDRQVRRALDPGERGHFMIAFAIAKTDLDRVSHALAAAAEGDALLWIAYPKGSSRRYRGEFNRDSGFAVLGAAGFEPVRQVAIDDDWSALRFRRVEFIRTLQRDPARAQSAVGRHRAGGG